MTHRHAGLLLILFVLAGAALPVFGQGERADPPSVDEWNLPVVTPADLARGLEDPARWLMYSGDYSSHRHSPLTQITPENVKRLAAQWTFQAPGMPPGRGFEATPVILDGVLFITGNNNWAFAVDARTGEQLWRHRRQLPAGLTYGGANIVNRGFAALGDRLLMGTLDAHLVALDRASGQEIWDVELADFEDGHALTLAPLVVKDMVIVGNSGGDLPTRGFIAAYRVSTGDQIWRFSTVAGPSEPGGDSWPAEAIRGGGAAWVTGSYDPELNLLYWGTGNPIPDYFGEDRAGDNLYTASIVALDADTGRLRWHYQFTPHDTHDWDSNQIPVLADLTIDGRARKVVMLANRNGFFYTLDRETGEVLVGTPFTETQWARELGPDDKPIVLNLGVVAPGETEATTTCVPDLRGGTNFNPPSYDPARQLFFVMARETCSIYSPQRQELRPGRVFVGGGVTDLEPRYGALRALDPTTGERQWEYRFPTPNLAGVMSTASGLVFAGDNEGYLNAFDATTGERLWRYQTGAIIWGGAPTSYMLDGRQYILMPSGTTLTAFALPEE